MFDILPWKAWLIRSAPLIIAAVVILGLALEFNRRGDKINRLETAQKATQAQLASERAEHAKTIEAYQAGLAAVESVSTRRIEVTTRLQAARTEINNAPVTTACADSPAVALALDGVRKAHAPYAPHADRAASLANVPAGASTAR